MPLMVCLWAFCAIVAYAGGIYAGYAVAGQSGALIAIALVTLGLLPGASGIGAGIGDYLALRDFERHSGSRKH